MRVLFADEQPVVLAGLTALFARDLPEAETVAVGTGTAALEALEGSAFDLVLLDFGLRDWDSLNLIKEITRRQPRLPILVASTEPEDPFAIAAYRAGAAGFISKNATCEDLSTAVAKLLAGQLAFSPWALETLEAGSRRESSGFRELSERETEIVALIANGSSMKDIAAHCRISTSSVNTYRQRILRKIGASSTSDILRYGWARGVRPVPQKTTVRRCQLYTT